MKKFLFTIFAFALIVACEKDAFEQDTYDINVVEAADEIGASVSFDGSIDSSFEFIGSVELPKSSSNETSKVGASGTRWLHIIFFDHNSQNLALLRGEAADESCWGNLPGFAHSTLYTWDTNTNTLTVVVEDASGESAPTPRVQSAANATRFDRLFAPGSTTNRIRVTNSRRSRAITGTPPAASELDFGCIPPLMGNAYSITPAPFPLNGFLARINSSFDFVTHGLDADALNYAGTSEQDVIDAIERDIMNSGGN